MLADQIDRAFPDLAEVRDARLRDLARAQWRYVQAHGDPSHTDVERIPLTPSLPLERYGGLASHVRAMMALARVVVPTYAKEWGTRLDLDHFLVAAVVHDSAKVIEFVPRDGVLAGTPGYDHAIEGARIAQTVGLPPEIVHMVAVHGYIGPRRLPRTAAAQLFQFMDPICLPVFPEAGKGVVERHLESNGWSATPLPEDLA